MIVPPRTSIMFYSNACLTNREYVFYLLRFPPPLHTVCVLTHTRYIFAYVGNRNQLPLVDDMLVRISQKGLLLSSD